MKFGLAPALNAQQAYVCRDSYDLRCGMPLLLNMLFHVPENDPGKYLRYIAQNCRWMLEDRPDQKSGKTWRRMKFDKFLTEKLYIEVREGDRDDR